MISYNLADCQLEGYDGEQARMRSVAPRGGDDEEDEDDADSQSLQSTREDLKPISSLTISRKKKLYTHKVRSLRSIGRKIRGPLWGTDVIVMLAESGNPQSQKQLAVWGDRIWEACCEAKLVDTYKMQVNLDGDEDDKPVNQKVAAVIKEGYMRKKKPGNNAIQDLKLERRYGAVQ